ncbi:MAG: hypothetical protein ACPLZH_02855 [Minisyncoccales bacterium]
MNFILKRRYKIVVSGAALLNPCAPDAAEKTKEIGRQIARENCILISGATTGIPYYAALGCKEEKGFSVGFSPASSEKSHIRTYRLPIDVFDVMIYTGSDYVGRDIIMTKAADALIVVCGRMGTLHEFATAFEIQRPIGVLIGSGGMADKIKDLITGRIRETKKIVFEKDPKRLVKKVISLIKKEKGR